MNSPVLIPFPTPELPEIAGVLPFEGHDVLVKVTTGGGWKLLMIDPTTGVKVTSDLSSVISALRRGS